MTRRRIGVREVRLLPRVEKVVGIGVRSEAARRRGEAKQGGFGSEACLCLVWWLNGTPGLLCFDTKKCKYSSLRLRLRQGLVKAGRSVADKDKSAARLQLGKLSLHLGRPNLIAQRR